MPRQKFWFTVLAALCLLSSGLRADEPAASSRWPMQFSLSDGRQVTVFQPQLDNLTGDELSARAAVSVQGAGQDQPIYGAVWLQSRIDTDRAARTVNIVEIQVTQSHFAGVDASTVQQVTESLPAALMAHRATLSLDQLLAMMNAVQQKNAQAANLKFDPPQIIFRDHPAVKVQYDGAPRLVEVPNTNFDRVINTPFFVVLDPQSRDYFLKGAGRWFAAPDPMGPFHYVGQIPDGIAQLADQSGYTDPQQPVSDSVAAGLEIVTATEPTELIWTDGQAQMTPISGTNLLYVANTDSDLFVTIDTQQQWVLLSGRWYSAPNQNGPWTFVPPDALPPDFSRIPSDSPKADVLAFVPGTPQAQIALQNTYLPQTAAVDRQKYEQPPVQYDGDPDFQPVDGTSLSYAINTSNSVLLDSGTYYCCYNAVWYSSPQPVGPWGICTRVPQEIYTIPPSCPIYPVTYTYIYGSTPDVVYVGYTPGYVGAYPYDGVVIYGTGYRYSTWAGTSYIPRPYTFGFGVRYDPDSGHWGFGFAMATGGGGRWVGESSGEDMRGGGWFGYGGYRPTFRQNDYHPQDLHRDPHQGPQTDLYQRNIYERRNDVHRELPGTWHDDQPAKPNTPQGGNNDHHEDLYTDPQGNLYRHTDQGWERRDQNDWKPAQQPVQPQAHPGKESHPEEQPTHQPQEQPRDDHPEQHQPAQPQQHQPAAPEQEHHDNPIVTPQQDQNKGGGNDNIDRLDRDRSSRAPAQPQEQPKQEQPRQEAPKQPQQQPAPSHEEPRQQQNSPGQQIPQQHPGK